MPSFSFLQKTKLAYLRSSVCCNAKNTHDRPFPDSTNKRECIYLHRVLIRGNSHQKLQLLDLRLVSISVRIFSFPFSTSLGVALALNVIIIIIFFFYIQTWQGTRQLFFDESVDLAYEREDF